MGTDIHTYSEQRDGLRYHMVEGVHPFKWRSYGMFAFLAGVRNYSAIEPISEPRGLPCNISEEVHQIYREEEDFIHSSSWLSVKELLDYNYDRVVEDRRCTIQISPRLWDGGSTCEGGKGTLMPLRDFLRADFFKDLIMLRDQKVDRIVFWFDS